MEPIRAGASPTGLLLLLLLSFSSACRNANKSEAAAGDASVVVAAANVPASSAPAPAVSAAPADEPQLDAGEATDAGDAGSIGRRKHRRVLDASALETDTAAPPPAPVATPSSEPGRGKHPPSPMSDDQPWGGKPSASAPALQKTPLPADDPWDQKRR